MDRLARISDHHTVVVDGSSIGRQGRGRGKMKPELDLGLLHSVVSELRRLGVHNVLVYVDASETAPCSPSRDLVSAALEEGWLRVLPSAVAGGADRALLQRTQEFNAAILSFDGFRQYVEEYPWLTDGQRLFSADYEMDRWIFTARQTVASTVIREVGALVAVGALSHHLECFQLVEAGRSLRHRWFLDGSWSDWTALHGGYATPATDLAAASTGSDHVEIFVRGSDRHIWRLWWTQNGGWNDQWEAFRGTVDGPIAAASLEPGHLEVYAFQHGQLVSRWRRNDGSWGEDWMQL